MRAPSFKLIGGASGAASATAWMEQLSTFELFTNDGSIY